MNDDCTAYRETLRAQFDAGVVIAPNAPDHADKCRECAAYRSELNALTAAFAAMPLEVPRNTLARSVKSRIASEPAYANDARWWLPAAAVLACALIVGAALYYSVPVDPWTWWDYANRSGATPEWMLGEISFSDDLETAQGYWNDFSSLFASISASLLWAVAAAAAIFLAALNGAEAYRLRTASNRTTHYRQWR